MVERCTAIAMGGVISLWLAAAGVLAAEAPAGWRCGRCPERAGWELDVTLAPAYMADDAYRFGDYTGLDEKGAYLFGDLFARYRDPSANYVSLDGFALSPDFAALFVEGGRQGRYAVRGSYRSIPRRFHDATVTPFQGAGTGMLTLPEGWVRGPNTGAMTALADTAAPVEIRRDWDLLRLGGEIRPDSRWRFSADYGHTERKGRNLDAGSFLFTATELTSPVDYTTDDLELSAEYRGDGWQGSVRYLGSFFDNGDAALAWENPYSGPTGVDAGARALAPDNESHQLAVSGAWRFPGRTVMNGQLSFSSLSQDEDLLPYTIDPTISAAPLPTPSADAKADVVNFNLRAVSSPWPRTTFEGEVRLNDFDNKTPVNLYDYVVTDTVAAPVPVANRAYDYERAELKLRGEYRASARVRFSLGFDTKSFQRNFQDRSRTRTNRVWFRVRSRLGDGGDVDLEAFVEDRAGSSFDEPDASAALENPLMRKYNLSDRERFGLRLTGSLYPASRWDVGWEVEYGRDDYEESRIGLTRTSYARAGLDASWLIVDRGSLYASLFTERVDVAQAGSQSFSLPDWTASTEDDFDTATVGFHHPALLGPIGVRFDYTWSRGTGETDNDTSGRVSRFPDLKSVRQTVGVGLDYALSDAWRLGFDYYHEKLDSHDWALDDLEPATVPNLLALGADPFNYDVNVVYFSVRYIARGQGL